MVSCTQQRALFWMCALLFTASLIFGGGTRQGFLSDALLQLLSIPIICLTLFWRPDRAVIVIIVIVVGLALLQLLPLPWSLWSTLPGREPVAERLLAVDSVGMWRPISLDVRATTNGLLSLLPALAVFASLTLLGADKQRQLSLILLGVLMASLFLGLAQVSQGPESAPPTVPDNKPHGGRWISSQTGTTFPPFSTSSIADRDCLGRCCPCDPAASHCPALSRPSVRGLMGQRCFGHTHPRRTDSDALACRPPPYPDRPRCRPRPYFTIAVHRPACCRRAGP